jgi:hypothetical protein
MEKDESKKVDVTGFPPMFFGRDGSSGLIKVWPRASKYESGELRYHLHLTNAESLVFPADFPVLVQCLAWSALVLAQDQKQVVESEKWSAACRQIYAIERLFGLP